MVFQSASLMISEQRCIWMFHGCWIIANVRWFQLHFSGRIERQGARMYKFRRIDDLVGKRLEFGMCCCADSFGTWCCTGCAWCRRPWVQVQFVLLQKIPWSFYVTLASVPLRNGIRQEVIKKTQSELCLQVVQLYTLHQPSRRRELCCELLQTWLGLAMTAGCKRLSKLNCSWCLTSLSGHDYDFKLVPYLKLHLSVVSSLRCDIRMCSSLI